MTRLELSISEIEKRAMAVLEEQELVLNTALDCSGKLVRCGTTHKPQGTDGSYILHLDFPPNITTNNYHNGGQSVKTQLWKKDEITKFSSEQIKDFQEMIRQRKEDDAKKYKEALEHTMARAIQEYNQAGFDTSNNEYLKRKGVNTNKGLKQDSNGRLVVPIYNSAHKVCSLQYISGDGDKQFLFGRLPDVYYYSVYTDNDRTKPLLICEGVATALSLNQATGLSVLASFSANNLLALAKFVRNKNQDRDIILAADFDEPNKYYSDAGGTGIAKARQAAQAIKGKLAVCPLFGGRTKADFNDLYQEADGKERVKAEIEAAITTEPLLPDDQNDDEPSKESEYLPKPPEVPLHVFPNRIQSLLINIATACNTPLQIPVACFLGKLAGLIGRSRRILVKESWSEPGNLWIGLVARSGEGKTPVLKKFFGPIERLEHEAQELTNQQYKDTIEDWKQRRAAIKKDGGDYSLLDERPEKPIAKQMICDDASIESLGQILAANPKGVQWLKDELCGLISDLSRYSNKSDSGKERLLSSYDCGRWKTTRVTNQKRNVDILQACVSIFGGIQPGRMAQAFKGDSGGIDAESGFLQRFIFIRSENDKPRYFTEDVVTKENITLLEKIAAHLWEWDIKLDENGNEISPYVPLSDKALEAYKAWHDRIANEAHVSENPSLYEKLKGQALRLCLNLHCLDAALKGTDGMELVSGECMWRAIVLAEWIKENQLQCWQLFKTDKPAKIMQPIERAIMEAAVENADMIRKANYRLPNQVFFPLVREKLNVKASDDKIGRECSKLKVLGKKINGIRYRIFNEEILNFKS